MRKFLFLSLAACFLISRSTAAPAAKDEARAIIEKAIKAHGGQDRLGKIKAMIRKCKGAFDSGAGFSFEETTLMSGQYKCELNFKGQISNHTTVYDGNKGWTIAVNGTKDIPEKNLQDVRELVHAYRVETLVPLLKDKGLKLSPLAETKVNDRHAVGVKVERKDYRDIRLYFDKQSGLLVKADRKVLHHNMGELNREEFYKDHKEFDGVKWYTKAVIHHDGNKYMEIEITEIKFPDKIDDSVFAKP